MLGKKAVFTPKGGVQVSQGTPNQEVWFPGWRLQQHDVQLSNNNEIDVSFQQKNMCWFCQNSVKVFHWVHKNLTIFDFFCILWVLKLSSTLFRHTFSSGDLGRSDTAIREHPSNPLQTHSGPPQLLDRLMCSNPSEILSVGNLAGRHPSWEANYSHSNTRAVGSHGILHPKSPWQETGGIWWQVS